MSWLQPQILRHFTALRPERKKWWSFSQVVWVIRNIEHLPVLFVGSEILNPLYCLGDQNFWILSCVLGDQKFWITCIVWGIRNSESSPVLFGGSEILNLLCFLAIRISESSPVFLGDQKLWISCVAWGIRNSESSPVLLGGSETLNLWVFACVPWRSKVRIFVRLLLGTSRDKKFRKSFSCLNLK